MDHIPADIRSQVAAMSGRTVVAKLGGSALGSHDTTLADAAALAAVGVRVVLVHGGGAAISDWLQRTGQEPRFIGGLRVTDAATLEMVVMVLAGKVNKELVGGVLAHGGRAIGLSGLDGAMLQARRRSEELGFVGDVTAVDTAPLEALLSAGYLPVVAPIAADASGQPLNVNADTAAAELAVALRAERMIFLSDVPGVCDAAGQLIPRLTLAQTRALIEQGVVTRGMIPKVEACFRALSMVPETQIVDGRQPHALLRELTGAGLLGTTISR